MQPDALIEPPQQQPEVPLRSSELLLRQPPRQLFAIRLQEHSHFHWNFHRYLLPEHLAHCLNRSLPFLIGNSTRPLNFTHLYSHFDPPPVVKANHCHLAKLV